jgi:predicted AAA+ superfamily ATPase
LAGRQPILEKARIALGRLKNGKSEKSFLLVGLRGVGKTVLLNEIHKLAEANGYKSIFVEAPAYGDTEFTVPLFDEFMKRVMPG